MTFKVTPTDFRGQSILSPQSPQRIDTPVRVSYVGDVKFIASVTVPAAIPTRSPPWSGSAATTRMGRSRSTVSARPELPTLRRSASTTSRFPMSDPPGGDAEKLLADILAEVDDPDNPYDVASTMVDYLQSSAHFEYDADVRDLACEDLSTVECFARYKPWLLPVLRDDDGDPRSRQHGIPTRLAARLPARRTRRAHRASRPLGRRGTPGSRSTSPATAGSRSTRRVATSRSRSRCRPARLCRRRPGRQPRATEAGARPASRAAAPAPRSAASRSGGAPSAGLLVVAVLLDARRSAWRLSPSGAVRAASCRRTRLGLGHAPRGSGSARGPPRPSTNTPARLASSCPAQAELETVAQAKVESTYGRPRLGDAAGDVRDATRRLRYASSGSLLRKPRKGRRRKVTLRERRRWSALDCSAPD